MSNIDDIFKDGLDGKGLEYSSANWAAMEGLLPAKKIGFLAKYKWALGVVMLVSVGAAYFLWGTGEVGNDVAVASSNTVSNIPHKSTDVVLEEEENNDKEDLKSDIIVATVTNQETLSAFEEEHGTDVIQVIEEDAGEIVSSTGNQISIDNSPEIVERAQEASSTGRIVSHSHSKQQDEDWSSNMLSDEYVLSSVTLESLPYSEKRAEKIEVEDFESVKTPRFSLSVSPFVGVVDYSRNQNLQGLADDFGLKASEKELKSLEYGVRIGVNKKKWSIVSGLEFLKLNEVVSYSAPTKETSYETKKMISNANFTTTSRGTRVALMSDVIVDSTENIVEKQICENCDFNVSYVRIPLNIQYNFGSGRLQYFGNAGASLLHATNAGGKYSIGENVALEIKDISTADVTRNMIQIDASIGARYRILNNLSVWGSINLSQGTVSMLNTYEQVPELRSIRVGLEIKL